MSCDKIIFSSFITTHTLFASRLKYIERITFDVEAEVPLRLHVNDPFLFI